jgi:hypothetical protein
VILTGGEADEDCWARAVEEVGAGLLTWIVDESVSKLTTVFPDTGQLPFWKAAVPCTTRSKLQLYSVMYHSKPFGSSVGVVPGPAVRDTLLSPTTVELIVEHTLRPAASVVLIVPCKVYSGPSWATVVGKVLGVTRWAKQLELVSVVAYIVVVKYSL